MISGAIAALLISAAVFALPSKGFSTLVAFVLLVPAWEWAGLAGVTNGTAKTLFALLLFATVAAIAWFEGRFALALPLLILSGFLFWCYACTRILNYCRGPAPTASLKQVLLAGVFVLLPSWAALASLHRIPEVGPALVMVLLFLVWATDTGAYFVGRRWGERKLAPKVSPGKTVAGLWGGLGFGLLTAGVAALVLAVGPWPLFVIVCMFAVGFAVVGDLFESMIKRQGDIKDSGSVLPGHGGALDRVDSLTAAAPAFALGMIWLLGNPH